MPLLKKRAQAKVNHTTFVLIQTLDMPCTIQPSSVFPITILSVFTLYKYP